MAWEGSTRKETLPPDWGQRRLAVFARDDNRCTVIKANGKRCWDKADECDHIGDRLDHSLENLRSICSWHHQRRSSSQGGKASAQRERAPIKRPQESHPGLIQKR